MRSWRLRLLMTFVAIVLGASPAAARLNMAAVNDAPFPVRPLKGMDPAMVKAQVLLDRARFSPGLVDGKGSERMNLAIAAFQKANGLAADGKLNEETWERLVASSPEPILIEYRITAKDVRGPFTRRIPDKMEEMARLPRLGYRNPLERLAERFHMDESLMKALNQRKRFDHAGTRIIVASVRRPELGAKAATIEIDKSQRAVRVFDAAGVQLAFYPASVGSEEKPAPTGSFTVVRVVRNPVYTYNPEFGFKDVKAKEPFSIAPGPNNPVGSVWIDLSAESYGIHGTPDPRKIGSTFSHGCIRLTNWDAEDLAAMATKGTTVSFLGGVE